MDKIVGTKCSGYYQGNVDKLSLEEVCKTLQQAKECCLYLFEKRVAWSDLNKGNIFITTAGKNLMLCDLGC